MLEFRDDFYATAFSGYIYIDECKRKKEDRMLVFKDGEDSKAFCYEVVNGVN